MQRATAVRVPATDRVQPLEEVLLPWLARSAISTKCLTARDQAEHECPHPYMASHAALSPVQFGPDRSPGSPRLATPESPAAPGLRNQPRRW
jgi:hypothetical protein